MSAGPIPEHAGVDGVVVRKLLGDLDDAPALRDDLGRVVDVEAAFDVAVDGEAARTARELGREQPARGSGE